MDFVDDVGPFTTTIEFFEDGDDEGDYSFLTNDKDNYPIGNYDFRITIKIGE